MTEREEPCDNWSVSEYDGHGYCGQHFASRVNAGIKATQEASRMAEIAVRIDAFLAWKVGHPSVWDPMPAGWTGEPVPVPVVRSRVTWSASSGLPCPVAAKR
jgi:hypothetical protein